MKLLFEMKSTDILPGHPLHQNPVKDIHQRVTNFSAYVLARFSEIYGWSYGATYRKLNCDNSSAEKQLEYISEIIGMLKMLLSYAEQSRNKLQTKILLSKR